MKHIDNGEHLDVRNVAEYRSTGVINGAILIPLRELESRIKELKGKKNITINCLSGLRSKIAFSVLAKYGIESRVLAEGIYNFSLEFKEFRNNGLNIVEYKE
jgi:rhodanese-related sulfurtransferase